MDYARYARTGNPSIAGKRGFARSADKVEAPHDSARKATASRATSARRVTRTAQESSEVDLPSWSWLQIAPAYLKETDPSCTTTDESTGLPATNYLQGERRGGSRYGFRGAMS